MHSYRKNSLKDKIHRIKPKKSIFKRLWFWILVLIVAFVVAICYFSLFYNGIQVKNIIISGNQKVASKDIENLAVEDITNRILKIGGWEVNSKSIFLADKDKIKKDILEKFPVIGEININKKFPQTLVLTITERQPLGAFCPSAGLEKAESNCFFIDQDGVVFQPLQNAPDRVLIVRQVNGVAKLTSGEVAVAPVIISDIYQIQKDLKDNFQIILKEAVISSSSRLNITTGGNLQIYFNLISDPDINSQLAELNSLLGGGIPADNMKNLRYIDLRPKDRAIVCDNSICGG